ncbi:hypothetical protein [Carboxylicivirga caseinilyticus]|uniref:hypothetical protein n=1 Tax=Carboxylicivirga caseinilyticus TaxID=3417572 RepID=UPI003D35982D|nr:hypothetical protein [Marinilabiliaceae bacterium A049]
MKKIKLLLVAMALLSFCHIYSQEYYYVISCKGNITVNNKPIKSRDKLYDNDKIKFSTNEDILYVLHNIKGSIELTPEGNINKDSELFAFLKEKYLAERSTTSSRSLELLQNTEDFYLYFNNIGYLLLTENVFYVDTANYPLNANSFFFIRYNYKGESINKKLPFSGNGVIINAKDLHSVDGNPIIPSEVSNYNLFYYDSRAKKSLSLSGMNLVFVDDTVIQDEIETILNSNIASEKQDDFIFQYLNMAYGNFDEKAIKKIISKKD